MLAGVDGREWREREGERKHWTGMIMRSVDVDVDIEKENKHLDRTQNKEKKKR